MSKIIKSVALHGKPKVITPPQHSFIKSFPDIELGIASSAPENELILSARIEAENILNQASNEASKLLSETCQSIEQLKTEAYHEGFQKGFAQGTQEGHAAVFENVQAQLDKARIQAEDITKAARQQANEMLQTAEVQIVEIALNIARKVLKREIDENPITVLPIVKEALSKVMDQESIVLRVNPDDIELLEHAKRDLQNMIGGEKKLSILADHTVSPGGCMIDTLSGTVDASIDTQFNVIKQALRGVVL